MDSLSIEEPLPHWATGLAHGLKVKDAVLCTRDGRRCGNGRIVSITEGCLGTGQLIYGVLTDMGTLMLMSANEVEESFYPPVYIGTESRLEIAYHEMALMVERVGGCLEEW